MNCDCKLSDKPLDGKVSWTCPKCGQVWVVPSVRIFQEFSVISRVPHSYREQHGCHNCQFVVLRQPQDCGPSYYCNIDKSPLPEPCSGPYDADAQDAYTNACAAWEEGREVHPAGICLNHQKEIKHEHGSSTASATASGETQVSVCRDDVRELPGYDQGSSS